MWRSGTGFTGLSQICISQHKRLTGVNVRVAGKSAAIRISMNGRMCALDVTGFCVSYGAIPFDESL